MDANTIPRRERRHYRQYKNGAISYSDMPIDKSSSKNYTNNYNSMPETKKPIKNLINMDEKNINSSVENKKIQTVLQNLSEIISPDIDSITDAIYNQIQNDDTLYDFKKKEIEDTIKNSKHYRATNEPVDYDNVKLLVEDVFVQLENENIKNSNVKNKKDTTEVKETSKKIKTTKKEDSKKTKKKEPKSEMQKLLSDEDDDSEDLDLDEDNDDDLGLKF